MTRPLRASTVKVLTRSPEPRRSLRWTLSIDYGLRFVAWQCLRCESGTGQAPTISRADQAAETHFRTNHEGPTP